MRNKFKKHAFLLIMFILTSTINPTSSFSQHIDSNPEISIQSDNGCGNAEDHIHNY